MSAAVDYDTYYQLRIVLVKFNAIKCFSQKRQLLSVAAIIQLQFDRNLNIGDPLSTDNDIFFPKGFGVDIC